MEKGQVKRESGSNGTDKEDKPIQNWLRDIDKPLAKKKQDKEGAEPKVR